MYKQNFGKHNQVQFANKSEYYELLGYLAKSDGSTKLKWEDNHIKGTAWGKELRIEFFEVQNNLLAKLIYTAGNGGSIISRVNCNEFVRNIVNNYGFVIGANQNNNAIRNVVPPNFKVDFDRGFNL